MMLYTKGNAALLETKCEAIVGTRKASPYGRWVAYELGKRLAEQGTTLITTATTGINERAISGCLLNGGNVIMVVAGGVDVIYPQSMALLFKDIVSEGGLIISRHEYGYTPFAKDFIESKRLLAQYADAITVVEAGLRSGAVLAAQFALEQGKEVRAVPGNINQPNSIGPNKLIADGAIAVVSL